MTMQARIGLPCEEWCSSEMSKPGGITVHENQTSVEIVVHLHCNQSKYGKAIMIGPAEIEDMMMELEEARLADPSFNFLTPNTTTSRFLSWGRAPVMSGSMHDDPTPTEMSRE